MIAALRERGCEAFEDSRANLRQQRGSAGLELAQIASLPRITRQLAGFG